MQASEAVERAAARLGKSRVYLPGWTNGLLVGFLTALPRRLGIHVAGARARGR
jgi:hypothetical protein